MEAPSPRSALLARIENERVVRLDAEAWQSVAERFPVRERHPTGLAGDLIVAESPRGPVGIETPETGDVYVRLFADEAETSAWVKRRLDQYERMWDG